MTHRFFLITLFSLVSFPLFSNPMNEVKDLSFYKETDLFSIYCEPDDQELVDKMTKEGEEFFKQLEKDFQYKYDGSKITVKIYPDIDSLHVAMGNPNAPAWLSGRPGEDYVMLVSPNNPGPFHTFDTARGILKRSLTIFVIHHKYGEEYCNKNVPRWIKLGTVLYKNDFYSPDKLEALIKEIQSFPKFEQLETVDQINTNDFEEKLNGIVLSFALVQFVEKTWGWSKILDLIKDYTKFESILGVTKSDFETKWHQFLKTDSNG